MQISIPCHRFVVKRLCNKMQRISNKMHSTTPSKLLHSQLDMFPEYGVAVENLSQGKFSLALPAMKRVHEVIGNAMGPSSDLAALVTRETANIMQYMGKYNEAKTILMKDLNNATSDKDKIRIQHHITTNYLLQCDYENAANEADKAVNLCEKEIPSTELQLPLELAGLSYSLRGLSALQLDDIDDAEEHLQLAARWSQHSASSQMIALHNLGLSHWNYDLRFDIIDQCKLWISDSEHNNDNTEVKSPDSDSEVAAIKEALGYWDEALEKAAGEDDYIGDGAAALCGPMGGSNSSLSMLGPGMESEARVVPSSSSISSKSNITKVKGKSRLISPDDRLASRLEDPSFTIAYATILCCASNACKALKQTERSAELLSAALKTVESHQNNLIVKPMLGYVLSLMAYEKMAQSQAVTAEGLFRAADEYLSGPYAINNPRWIYERGYVLGGYGVLLSKWEKRHAESVKQAESSKELLATVNIPVPHYIVPQLY